MVSANTDDEDLRGGCFVNFPVLVPPERRTEIVRSLMFSGYDVGRDLKSDTETQIVIRILKICCIQTCIGKPSQFWFIRPIK